MTIKFDEYCKNIIDTPSKYFYVVYLKFTLELLKGWPTHALSSYKQMFKNR